VTDICQIQHWFKLSKSRCSYSD